MGMLELKMIWYRIRLEWLRFSSVFHDKVLGEYTVHHFGIKRGSPTLHMYHNGKMATYQVMISGYGRTRLKWWARVFAKPHWYTPSYPNLLMKYSSPEMLEKNHIEREECFYRVEKQVEKLNQITDALNLKINQFSA